MTKVRYKLFTFLMLTVLFIAGMFTFGEFKKSYAAEEIEKHYYLQLNSISQNLYKAIDTMQKDGILKKDESYDLVENEVLEQDVLAAYETGNSALIRAFGAAKDAYNFDNPDVFYVDFSQLSLRIGTKIVNGKKQYTAYIGSGKNESYLIDKSLSEIEIDQQITNYENKLTEITTEAATKTTIEEQIKFVNEKIIDINEYSFESSVNAEGDTILTDYAPYINTSYGAIVNNKSIAEGYSKVFKSVMDRLNIPCILVQGYGVAGNDDEENLTFEKHIWNYVQVEDDWYGVDTTWNDTIKNIYTLIGEEDMKIEHIPEGILSFSNYGFNYPRLSINNYGFAYNEGLRVINQIKNYGTSDASMVANVSFNGLGAKSLNERGLYLIVRTGSYDAENNLTWTNWTSASKEDEMFEDLTTSTNVNVSKNVNMLQFAVVRTEPCDNPDGGENDSYSADTKIDFVAISNEITNEVYEEDYISPPNISIISPNTMQTLDATKTYTVEIIYSEALKQKTAGQEIGVDVSSPYADISNKIILKDFVWSETESNKVSFSFRGSLMHEHNNIQYQFRLINLIGKESNKTPVVASLRMQNIPSICGNLYQDKLEYAEFYSKPTILGSQDLSLKDWKVDNELIAENLKNQLLLTTNLCSQSKSSLMLEKIDEINENTIQAAQTYAVTLQLQGKIVEIPTDKHINLGLSFPEEYTSESKGVSYQVYRFELDNEGNIVKTEEVNCVLTKAGLVVSVDKLGIFSVVVVGGEQTEKTVLVNVAGNGNIEAFTSGGQAISLSGVLKVQDGDTATFTINPKSNYQIENLLLNGYEIEHEDGVLILNYSQLGLNNILTANITHNSVMAFEQENDISNINPIFKEFDSMGDVSVIISTQAKNIYKGKSATLSAYIGISNNLNNKQGVFTYQWYKDGVAIEGATNGFLSIDNFNKSDIGEYFVQIQYTVDMRTKTVYSENLKLDLAGINYAQLVFGVVIGLVTIVMCGVLFISNKPKAKDAK